jgi:hypothetical protein
MSFAKKQRAAHRTTSDVWMRLAGQLAVAADFAIQAANAARIHDAHALDALVDHLRLVVFDTARLHSTNREHLNKEIKS